MQSIFLFMFVEAFLANLFHHASSYISDMILFSRFLCKWEEENNCSGKIFFSQMATCIYIVSDHRKRSGLTEMCDYIFQGAFQCPYKEFPELDRSRCPTLQILFITETSDILVSHALSSFHPYCPWTWRKCRVILLCGFLRML